jgi:hypothetical protein
MERDRDTGDSPAARARFGDLLWPMARKFRQLAETKTGNRWLRGTQSRSIQVNRDGIDWMWSFHQKMPADCAPSDDEGPETLRSVNWSFPKTRLASFAQLLSSHTGSLESGRPPARVIALALPLSSSLSAGPTCPFSPRLPLSFFKNLPPTHHHALPSHHTCSNPSIRTVHASTR